MHLKPTRIAKVGVAAWLGMPLIVTAVAPADELPSLPRYETTHYVLYTDLNADGVRDAILRMDAMVDEYTARTRGFRGSINKRLPFYLFSNPKDYYASGGMPGSAGVFWGDRLMAIAGPSLHAGNWHIVQHEGFHQFVDAVIRGDIPVWVNEGLAEYFGEALFTGKGYISGIIPPERLRRIQRRMAADGFKPLTEIMLLDLETWNQEMAAANYDQAWSLVHFLAHGDNEKYQQRLILFAQEAGRGRPWEQAWIRHFGKDIPAFEARWREYWTNLPPDPTAHLYTEAAMTILTHHLARAASQRQLFADAATFFETARAGRLEAHPDDWLSPVLLTFALRRIESGGEWSLERKGTQMSLICITSDGNTLTGSYRLRNKRVAAINVDQSTTKPRRTGSKPAGRD